MQQVLFRIPLDRPWSFGPIGEFSGFGWGIVLVLWAAFAGSRLYRHRSEFKWDSGFLISAGIWCVVAFVVIQLPVWVHRGTDREIVAANAVIVKLPGDKAKFREAYAARDHAWRSKSEFRVAIEAYEKEIREKTAVLQTYANLAWIFATAPDADVRNGKRAVELATFADRMTRHQDARVLDTLAAAHAENGDFPGAISIAEEAAQVSTGQREGRAADVGQLGSIRQRMQLYKQELSYRDKQVGVFLPVYGYGMMLFLGFVAAGWTAIRRGRLVGISKDAIWDVSLWVLVGGIGGARLFYVVQYRAQVFAGTEGIGDMVLAAVNLREGGLVLYGGVLLAMTGFLLFCARRKLSPLLMCDVIIASFFVGLAFGRVGCFMNGCCYGDRSNLPWAITFPLGSVPDMALVSRGVIEPANAFTLQLHPSQLYSSLNALILAVLTHCYFKMRPRDGAVLGLALLTYPVTRFLLEYVRGDETGRFNTSLTISQWVSIGLFSLGLVYLTWLARRPEKSTPLVIAKKVAKVP